LGLLTLGRGAAPIGLDIGSSTFRIAQLKVAEDKPVLINYETVKTPQGLITEGEVTDIDGVSKVLASFWREKKISEKKVVVGVANQKVVVRVIEMPYMSENELRSAIQFQLGDYIPIPIEEAIIDFQIISEHENEQQGKMMDVLVVAARKDMIENTIAAVEGAGLKPVIVDVASLAFARAVLNEEHKDEKHKSENPQIEQVQGETIEAVEAIAMINISSNMTDIVVVEDGIPRFTRISNIGGHAFTEAISEQLGFSLEEAENLKIQIGLPIVGGGQISGIDPEIAQYAVSVQSILEQEMTKFIAEIRRSLDYYLVQAKKARSINKIIVSGSGAKLNNFLQHFRESLQIDVELGHPLKSINVKRKSRGVRYDDEELSMAICLGLALRGIER
jgi:type IV pilus assembly protein PilM